MMIGELEYQTVMLEHDTYQFSSSKPSFNDELYSENISFFVYFIFLFIMTIIATNLLTGLAVDDIEKIRGKAETQRLGMVMSHL